MPPIVSQERRDGAHLSENPRMRKSTAHTPDSGTKTEVSHGKRRTEKILLNEYHYDLRFLIAVFLQPRELSQHETIFVGYLGFCARIDPFACTFSFSPAHRSASHATSGHFPPRAAEARPLPVGKPARPNAPGNAFATRQLQKSDPGGREGERIVQWGLRKHRAVRRINEKGLS